MSNQLEISASDLQELEKKADKEPNNHHFLNTIALAYFENYQLNKNHLDYFYFNKAMEANRTIKSLHNLAWFLFFEWSEIEWRVGTNDAIERAVVLQKECISLHPQSYYPYSLYAYMLTYDQKYAEAIPYYLEALKRKERIDLLNNLGICYVHENKLDEAFQMYKKVLEMEKPLVKSQFCMALIQFLKNDLNSVQKHADFLQTKIQKNLDLAVGGYDIALLYFLIEDYDSVIKCTLKQGLNHINIFEWDYISYSFWISNKDLWIDLMNEKIEELDEWIENEQIEKDKLEYISRKEKLVILLNSEQIKPKIDIKSHFILEYCGCLMFDCQRHKNPFDDIMQ